MFLGTQAFPVSVHGTVTSGRRQADIIGRHVVLIFFSLYIVHGLLEGPRIEYIDGDKT